MEEKHESHNSTWSNKLNKSITDEELIQQLKLSRRLHGIRNNGLQKLRVPLELMTSANLDLSLWSLLSNDDTLFLIAQKRGHDMQRGEKIRQQQLLRRASENTIKKIAESRANFTPITSLTLKGAKHITDRGIKIIASVCQKLENIEIEDCRTVTDVGLRELLGVSHSLKKVVLRSLPELRGSALDALAEAAGLPQSPVSHQNVNAMNKHSSRVKLEPLRSDSIETIELQDKNYQLQQLDVNGSVNIAEWAFRRIWGACGHTLLEVKVAGCIEMTDECLRAMVTSSPLLRYLDLSRCRNLSDVGVLVLGHSSRRLQTLFLSGCTKLTDVSLLSIAEGCRSLIHLEIVDLDKITDTGIAWLANGCSGLVNLNFTGCSKLTDASLLSLTDTCHLLQQLNLSQVKNITDIGIRYLANQCPHISSLTLSGLYHLTDGKARHFGLEGLRALMLYSGEKLTSINLTGCFQIGDRTVAAIADKAVGLTFLSLCSCSRVGTSAIICIAEKCKDLETINLAFCSLIQDDAIVSLANNCKKLTSVNITGCGLITDSAIYQLVRKCTAIQTLHLNSCQLLTDASIAAIVEANMHPGLAVLSLRDCPLITEVILQWLVQSCLSLLYLDVLGTRISKSAIRSVREAWTYVETCIEVHTARENRKANSRPQEQKSKQTTQGFLGIKPKPRARDWRIIESLTWLLHSVVVLQSHWRGRKARKFASLQKKKREEERAAISIQSFWRRKIARDEFLFRRSRYNHKVASAEKIQAIYRGHLSRLRVKRIRRENELKRKAIAVTKISAWWHGKVQRIWFLKEVSRKREMQKRRQDASSRIGNWWRSRLVAKEDAARRLARQKWRRRRVDAVVRIQSWKELRRMKNLMHQIEKLRNLAALRIQKEFRRYSAQLLVKRLREERSQKEYVAILLQAAWRGRKGRITAQSHAISRQFQIETRAANVIQRSWRIHKNKENARHSMKYIIKLHQQREKASRVIQGAWKRYKDHLEASLQKNSLMSIAKKKYDLEVWAAVVIQSYWRAYEARTRANQYKEMRVREWISLTEDNGKPFYFNARTNEIRLSMPQELLDKLPPPKCSNCEVLVATVECSECGEYFCADCNDSVHYGGRRKAHKRRPVYDFYGHRREWPEGEWPSPWPSQNETTSEETNSVQGLYQAKQVIEKEKEIEVKRDADLPVDVGHEQIMGNQEMLLDGQGLNQGLTQVDPVGWTKHWDDESQRPYYYHAKLQQSSYDRPIGFTTPRKDDALEPKASGTWECHIDDEYGIPYYYNHETGLSTYRKPADFFDSEFASNPDFPIGWSELDIRTWLQSLLSRQDKFSWELVNLESNQVQTLIRVSQEFIGFISVTAKIKTSGIGSYAKRTVHYVIEKVSGQSPAMSNHELDPYAWSSVDPSWNSAAPNWIDQSEYFLAYPQHTDYSGQIPNDIYSEQGVWAGDYANQDSNWQNQLEAEQKDAEQDVVEDEFEAMLAGM